MPVDKVTLEILANHCRAATESMAYTLYRTAHSTFVKETEDFTIGLLTPDGKTFAIPMDLGATWFPGLDYGAALDMVPGGYEDGDIAFTNDPYSGYVSTHTPDLHMWKPVFHDGELICFTCGHIHNTDIGGAVPASLSRALVEIHQEGIRFTPCKLYRRGVLNDELLQVMLTNVRQPEQNWGDLKAFVGAMNTGARKVAEMIGKFGVDVFREGVEDLLDYAEHQARDIVSGIPDGEYFFSDYTDEDSESERNPCRLALNLKIDGDSAVLDFTGCDPQLASSINVPTGGNPHHTLMLVGVYYVLYTLNPNILLNAGLTRPFTCILPEGTVVNPQFPAAVGMRSLTCGRLRSLVFGAFGLAMPERMPAAPAGSSSIVNVMTTDNRSGKRIIAAIDPVVGGAGGMPAGDGPDGSGADAAYLKNTPVELIEAEVPIEILRYGLAPDSGGAGETRGGLGTILEFKVFSPGTRITARNRDRTRFRPWGILGGKAAVPSNFILNPGTDRERVLGNIDTITAEPGDVVHFHGPGGGGRGSPLARDPARVLRDVQRGSVTVDAAAADYGVVIQGGTVDETETAKLRARMRRNETAGHFDFGPERVAYERLWDRATYDALTEILARLPVHWRFFVKSRIFDAVTGSGEDASGSGRPVDGAALVRAAFADITAAHPQIREHEDAPRQSEEKGDSR
ncbi:MAG: hydantoinase B/oxoprolinase family protein [Alphaproteobacteria bacterium]|nr:hydantoinase B/oxoprolinase family protein [Alphaproteobacteria bacterium]